MPSISESRSGKNCRPGDGPSEELSRTGVYPTPCTLKGSAMSLSSHLGRAAPLVIVVALGTLAGCHRKAPREEPKPARTETHIPAFALAPPEQSEPSPPSPPVAGDLAIANVTVIDVVAGVARSNQTVVVQADTIAAIGPAATTRFSDDVRVIDGRGKFLIPGLWDMHAHLADPAMPDLFARHGVTGVRHMFSINPAYKYQAPKDAITGPVHPRVIAAHQLLDGPDTAFPWPADANVVKARDAATARAAVRAIREKGNDFVKVHAALSREAYFAAIEEARVYGMAVVGHVPRSVTAAEASDAGHLTIEHLDGVAVQCSSLEERLLCTLRHPPAIGGKSDVATAWRVQVEAHRNPDPAKADALFRKFAKNGTWHVPTLVQTRAMARLGDPSALDPTVERELPQLIKHFWKRQVTEVGVTLPNMGIKLSGPDLADRRSLYSGDLNLVGRMHTAGVRLLAGTDTPAPLVVPGAAVHDELALFVEAGLTPAEALRTATVNAAECLKMTDRAGSINAGKWADLVLLEANPLENIHNTRLISAVIVGGRIAMREFIAPAGLRDKPQHAQVATPEGKD